MFSLLSSIETLFPVLFYLSNMPEQKFGRGFVILSMVIVGIIGAAALSSGCLQGGAGTGTLVGQVSIGPLCPVEPCAISHDQLVAAYAARPITISTTYGSRVTTVTADPESGYSVALNPGTYIVDIPHQGIAGSRELPATVTIHNGEIVRLDISIDTGIR